MYMVYFNLAMNYQILSQNEKSMKYYEMSIQDNPKYSAAILNFSNLLIKENKRTQAKKTLENYLLQNPNDEIVQLNLNTLLIENDLESNNSIQNKMFFKDYKIIQNIYNYGVLLYKQNKLQSALKAFDQYILAYSTESKEKQNYKENKNLVDNKHYLYVLSNMNQGLIYEQLNQNEKAIEVYKNLLNIIKGDKLYVQNMNLLFNKIQKLKKILLISESPYKTRINQNKKTDIGQFKQQKYKQQQQKKLQNNESESINTTKINYNMMNKNTQLKATSQQNYENTVTKQQSQKNNNQNNSIKKEKVQSIISKEKTDQTEQSLLTQQQAYFEEEKSDFKDIQSEGKNIKQTTNTSIKKTDKKNDQIIKIVQIKNGQKNNKEKKRHSEMPKKGELFIQQNKIQESQQQNSNIQDSKNEIKTSEKQIQQQSKFKQNSEIVQNQQQNQEEENQCQKQQIDNEDKFQEQQNTKEEMIQSKQIIYDKQEDQNQQDYTKQEEQYQSKQEYTVEKQTQEIIQIQKSDTESSSEEQKSIAEIKQDTQNEIQQQIVQDKQIQQTKIDEQQQQTENIQKQAEININQTIQEQQEQELMTDSKIPTPLFRKSNIQNVSQLQITQSIKNLNSPKLSILSIQKNEEYKSRKSDFSIKSNYVKSDNTRYLQEKEQPSVSIEKSLFSNQNKCKSKSSKKSSDKKYQDKIKPTKQLYKEKTCEIIEKPYYEQLTSQSKFSEVSQSPTVIQSEQDLDQKQEKNINVHMKDRNIIISQNILDENTDSIKINQYEKILNYKQQSLQNQPDRVSTKKNYRNSVSDLQRKNKGGSKSQSSYSRDNQSSQSRFHLRQLQQLQFQTQIAENYEQTLNSSCNEEQMFKIIQKIEKESISSLTLSETNEKNDNPTDQSALINTSKIDELTSEEQYQLALIHFKEEKWVQAKEILSDLSKKCPEFNIDNINLALGDINMQQANYLFALQNYSTFYKHTSDKFFGLLKIAKAQSSLEQYSDALFTLVKAQNLQSKDYVPYYQQALIYQKMNDNNNYLHFLEKAHSLNNKNIETLVRLGDFFINQYENDKTKIDNAFYYYNLAYKMQPENFNCLIGFAKYYEINLNYTHSIQLVQEALQQNQNYNCKYYLALLFVKNDQIDNAIKTLKNLLQVRDTNQVLQRYYLLIRQEDEDFQKIPGYYKRLSQLEGLNQEEIQIKYIQYFKLSKLFDQGIVYLKQLIEVNKDSLLGYVELANCYILKGECEQAVSVYKQMMSLLPSTKGIFKLIGQAYYDFQIYKTALEYFHKAYDEDQEKDIYIKIGHCFFQLKQYYKAIDSYVQNINDDEEMLNNLCKSYYETEQYEKAVTFYESCLNNNFKSYQIYYNLGESFVQLKRYNEAQSCFQEVLKIESDHKQSYYNLGLLNYILNEKQKAFNYFENSIFESKNTVWKIYVAKLYIKNKNKIRSKEILNEILEYDKNNIQAQDLLFLVNKMETEAED